MPSLLPPDPALVERAVALARHLADRAALLQTSSERRQLAKMDRMLRHPGDKATLMQMTDRAFRARSAARTVEEFAHLLTSRGIPRFFNPAERALLRAFRRFAPLAPGLAVPPVKQAMRREAARVILPAEAAALPAILRARQNEGLRMNVNFLGEALLGETEAARRLERYCRALRMPEVEVLSVKISTLYSQISPLAREHTVGVLSERLEVLYRTAAEMLFTRSDGSRTPKFIYLDMEEYRDMSLTAEAFMRTLDRLPQVSAGIALQAYLPDSLPTQQAITAWARERVEAGGAPVVIRLVKGANLEMERVEASLRGWPQAPFKSKRETDANYKRMLHFAFHPENLAAVRIGVASHKLFEVGYAMALAEKVAAGGRVQFEMLEGMANGQRRALAEQAFSLLLYAPACRRDEFVSAIGYLVRRLDENTGPENFLRHAFALRSSSAAWARLEQEFRASFAAETSGRPRRTQNRIVEESSAASLPATGAFTNEPDTDFALPANAAWATGIVERWKPLCGERAADVPLVVDDEEIRDGCAVRDCRDPSRPDTVIARYREAGEAEVARALACAQRDEAGWRGLPQAERDSALERASDELRRARGRLIGAALANTGKTIAESDPEVSEAIDFTRFYAESAQHFHELHGVRARGCGVAAVVPPWNFPIAIPCGGIAAALAAGNTVILKPASPAVLVAWELCQCFWRAGISRKTLQFLPCSGAEMGTRLVTDPAVDAVILTGGTATALTMLRAKPGLPLYAETGGKNATIVTALSDREQAIRHVVHSAFSHGGQKCSATSLLLLEAEVYDDPHFREMLVDAARSMCVGSAWEPQTRMGPLIRPPRGELERGLRSLEPGEWWALKPERRGGNPHLWSPGIKYGVQPGSFTHRTELFGPVLGVMRFTGLEEAIQMANATGYGLTSGLQSLDEREQAQWRRGIRAGNLYLNKPTVGAIVLRQPFGGWEKSSIGPGMKAGGPNYVAQFMEFENALPAARETPSGACQAFRAALAAPGTQFPPEQLELTVSAHASYERAAAAEFSKTHDHFRLLGEDNLRRYEPISEIRVRVDERDTHFEVFARIAAARIARCKVTVSWAPGSQIATVEAARKVWGAGIVFCEETDDTLAEAARTGNAGRLRFAERGRVPAVVRRAAAETGAYIADRSVCIEGRIELLWYLGEQSISDAYHRYGNLGARAGEARIEPH
jgi:RHH-type transcriptional regulator, proline utilization regulon repressor / proline dehydrogenase / delta 1-pyrroline-5-carboxylate dehydrogenase